MPVIPDVVAPRWWRFACCLSTTFAIITPGVLLGDQGTRENASWRRPDRDGVNCLFLQLRLLGYKGTYDALLAVVPGGPDKANLATLSEAARRVGFDLIPAKLTVNDLSGLNNPTIVFMQDAGTASGRFDLLLGLSPQGVHMVDGNFVTCHDKMSVDRFRRSWSGFALLPKQQSWWQERGRDVAIGFVMGGGIVWLVARYARNQIFPSSYRTRY